MNDLRDTIANSDFFDRVLESNGVPDEMGSQGAPPAVGTPTAKNAPE
jgi:hypothetical protein